MILAISGPPGSGKTTVAEAFARAHRCDLISAGTIFRKEAADRGMTLERFGAYAEAHKEVDRKLDAAVAAAVEQRVAKRQNVVVDGRLQPWLLARRGIPCFKVLIDAPLEVRSARVAGREGKPLSDVRQEILERERSERTRYLKIYGIEVQDASGFDLVIDSSNRTPEAIVAFIGERVASWAR